MRRHLCPRHHADPARAGFPPGGRSAPPPGGLSASVDVAVPALDEERALPGCVRVLHDFLDEQLPFRWTITVVDSGSADGTRLVADDLASWCPRIRVLPLDRPGKGRAVRAAWASSAADIVAYLDVDLSTGLDALLPLLAPLANGHSDLAVGSRTAPGARTVRRTHRQLLSRGYNVVLRLTSGTRLGDAQCGLKAGRADVVRPLLRHVRDDGWFFDTELLLLAERNGLRVHQVAVDWVEDPDSRVRIPRAVAGILRGLARVAAARARGTAGVAGLPARPPPRRAHPLAARSGPGAVPLPATAGSHPLAATADEPTAEELAG